MDKVEEIAKKLMIMPIAKKSLENILTVVKQLLNQPEINNYLIFMKIKNIINFQLENLIADLNSIPEKLKQNIIEYINNNQTIPILQNYLTPAISTNEVSLFNIEVLKTNKLTTNAGMDYGIDYIAYVCGGSDNISKLIMNQEHLLIIVKDISKIIWTFNTRNDLYRFSETYLFNYWMEDENDEIIQNKKFFEEIKNIVNINSINNFKGRLMTKNDNENLNKITVKFHSSDDEVNKAFFQKIKDKIELEQKQNLLTKSAMRTIKSTLFLKNNWQKYELLSNVVYEKEINSLYKSIYNAMDIIVSLNDSYIEELIEDYYPKAIDNLKRSNHYFIIYCNLKEEIKSNIWEAINNEIRNFVLKDFWKNQIESGNSMNKMWEQYQIK